MKKTLTLIALALTTLSASAQVINVYKSDGTFVASYDGTHSVEMAKEAPATGPEYVEITYDGTTTKWAKWNLGATSIADGAATSYGDYYAWGEVDTYYTSPLSWTDYLTATDPITFKSSDKTHITGTKSGYDWNNYYGSEDAPGSEPWSPAPYDGDGVLTNDYDVVNKTYGGTWRMSKKEDFVNLCLACGVSQDNIDDLEPEAIEEGSSINAAGVYWIKYEGTTITIDGTDYNVPGLLFVTSNDTSKRVFFPAAGYMYGSSLYYAGARGYYWSSSLYSSSANDAYYLIFRSGLVYPQGDISRFYGFTVRPVSE